MTPSTFITIPNRPRVIRATEARLNAVYEAAKLGLRGETLALASGMSPDEFRLMSDMDPLVNMAILAGAAESEMIHSQKLSEASLNGDVKATIAILERKHGWVPKSEVTVSAKNLSKDDLKLLSEEEIGAMLMNGEYTVVRDGD